jgi:hypothetical protein
VIRMTERIRGFSPKSFAGSPAFHLQTSQLDFKLRAARAVLVSLILIGALFRIWAIGWGIPDVLPAEATACRNSYHLDEDDYLRGAARISIHDRKVDVLDYHWGTLQFYLIACALKGASLFGYLTRPWRDSFANLNPIEFSKIYMVGRTVSVVSGIASIILVFLIGNILKNFETGLLAAAFFSVSPLHVVNSHFLTSDITMVFLLLGSLYFFLSSVDCGGIGQRIGSGFLLGLAIAAKYNAAFMLPLWICGEVINPGLTGRKRLLGYAAVALGFAMGEPSILIHPGAVLDSMGKGLERTVVVDPLLLSWPRLLIAQTENLAKYGLTWTVATLGGMGLVVWFVRRSHRTFALGVAVILISMSLVAAKWPMIRYTLPLIPIGVLAAAEFISILPIRITGRLGFGIFVCLLPLSTSWAQLRIMSSTHPANQAARWIEANVPPGSRIGQIWPEMPPLDACRYNLRALHGLFSWDHAEPQDLDRQFLVLDNLPIQDFSQEFIKRLERNYVLVAEFRSVPHVGPWSLNEKHAPHDWKYTHPVMQIYASTRSAYQ